MKRSEAVKKLKYFIFAEAKGLDFDESERIANASIEFLEIIIGMLPPEKIEIYDNHRILKHAWDEE